MELGRFAASAVVVALMGLAGGVGAMGQTVRVVMETGDQTSFEGVDWRFDAVGQGVLWMNDAGEVAFSAGVRATGSATGMAGLAVAGQGGWGLRLVQPAWQFPRIDSFSNLTNDAIVVRGSSIFGPSGTAFLPTDGDAVPGLEGAVFVTGAGRLPGRIGNDGTMVYLAQYIQGNAVWTGLFSGYGENLRTLAVRSPSNGFRFATQHPAVASGGLYALAGDWSDEFGVPRQAMMVGDALKGTLVPAALVSQSVVGLPEDVVLLSFQEQSTQGDFAINVHGDVVFCARVTGPGVTSANAPILGLIRDGEARLLVRGQDPTPSGGVFSPAFAFTKRVAISDSGHVVFAARDEGGFGRNDMVLWKIEPDGSLHELVRPGQPVPGRSDGAVWPQWSFDVMGFSMNQRGDVLVVSQQDHVVFEASGIVRNVWAIGRRYLTADGEVVRGVTGPRFILANGGGNDGLGRRINASGAVCVVSQPLQSSMGPGRVLVIDPPDSPCDSVDFNYDASLFDPTDVDAFLSVFSEGPCVPAHAICGDADFNNDGAVGPEDVESFLSVFGEGPCV